jgi:HEAT repeat protein/lysophospholipase L1-like esterase
MKRIVVPRLLGNVLLAGAVSLVFLGSLEGLFRFLEARRPPRKVADYIWDWEKQWEGDFYTVTSDAVGWPPWQEFNADGLRDRARAVEKLPGTWRVVGLGDSVTMGAGIEPGEAWPQLLEARYAAEGRDIEVLNVALWGWSTRQERIAYDRFVRKRKPDQVLLGVCLNDIPELQNNLVRPPRLLAALHERSALVRRIVNAEGREIQDVEQLFREKDSAAVKEAMGRFFTEVRALRDEVKTDGAELSVIIFPFRFQVAPRSPPPSVQQAIRAFCARERIGFLDLLPRLREMGEGAFLDYDHLSPNGTRVVAEEIARSGLVAGRPAEPDNLGRSSLPDLEKALADEDPRTRVAAARALGARGKEASAAVPLLFRALSDGSENARWSAAQALWRIEPPAKAAVPGLVAALASPDPYVRGFAAWALGNMGPDAREAIPALIAALREEEKAGRGTAILAVAKMGPLARDAVPVLIETLRSPFSARRWNAARALGRMGDEARPAVPALAAALRDPNVHVRAYAARALGRLGPAARDQAAALEIAAHDDDDRVRREAARALDRIRDVHADSSQAPPAERDVE